MNNIPVIFLAFADDNVNPKKKLRHLPTEEEEIRKALQQAEKDQLCKVIIRYNATLNKILEVFREYKDRIAIFHFSGHGDDYSICLETPFGKRDIIHADGFSGYLGAQKGLQLVFLNACATQEQSNLLHERGIPIVITTLQEVEDEEATNMAIYFYQELGIGSSIESAYVKAVNLLQSRGYLPNVTNRGLGKEKHQNSKPTKQWILNVQPEKPEAKDWNLPEVANTPLYNIPILETIAFPPEPFPAFEAYTYRSANVFWGRDYEIRNLFDILHKEYAHTLVVLYGASGVGKTSLLQAGLIPRISEQNILLNSSIEEYSSPEIEQQLKNLLKPETIPSKEERQFIVLDGLTDESTTLLPMMAAIHKSIELDVTFILTMQTSFLSKWETVLEEQQLDYRSIYLPPISEKGILSVFKNLKKATYYGFKGELPLEESIANLLHRDSNSPITPIFQILMYQLWQAAKTENHTQPDLSMTLYRKLERKGIWENIISEQMNQIDQSAFESGLFLNILEDCSTNVDGLENHSIPRKNILNKYKHLGTKINILIRALISKRILSDPAVNKLKESHKIRLSHALLHIPLLRLINQSSRGGQEARRLLAQHQHNMTLLNKFQLEIVETHLHAIPDLSEQEVNLIHNSKKSIKENLRKKQVKKYRLRITLGLLLFGILFYSNIYFLVFMILLVILYK